MSDIYNSILTDFTKAVGATAVIVHCAANLETHITVSRDDHKVFSCTLGPSALPDEFEALMVKHFAGHREFTPARDAFRYRMGYPGRALSRYVGRDAFITRFFNTKDSALDWASKRRQEAYYQKINGTRMSSYILVGERDETGWKLLLRTLPGPSWQSTNPARPNDIALNIAGVMSLSIYELPNGKYAAYVGALQICREFDTQEAAQKTITDLAESRLFQAIRELRATYLPRLEPQLSDSL